MRAKSRTALAALFLASVIGLGAADQPLPSHLPVLPPQLLFYEPDGGSNPVERMRVCPLTGAFFYFETDLRPAGSALAPVLQRFYRAPTPTGQPGLFGRGWRTILDRRLTTTDSAACLLTDEWGKTWRFRQSGAGEHWAEQGPPRRLQVAANNTILHDSDGLSYWFDPAGSLTAVGYAGGRQLAIERDPKRPSLVRSVRDSFGNLILFETDPTGLVARAVSSDGQKVTYQYRNDLLVGVQPEHGAASRYSYDDLGRLIEVALAGKSLLQLKWDSYGRLTQIAGPGVPRRQYSYRSASDDRAATQSVRTDSLGDKIRWQLTDRSGQADHIDIARGDEGKGSLETDPRGRPLRLLLGDSALWLWRYDDLARIQTIEEPGGSQRRFYYSARRLQPDRIALPDGSAVHLTYDEKERLTTVRFGSSAPWWWEHDDAGRCRVFEDYFHGRFEVEYDKQGRVTTLTGPSGEATVVERDGQGRVASIGRPYGPAVRFARDEAGRVTRADDGVEWLDLEYNRSGNVTGVGGSRGYKRRFYFGADGLLVCLQRPGDSLHRLLYDGERNCIGIRRPDRTQIHIGRRPGNQIEIVDAGGLARWNAAYDAWGRPTRFGMERRKETSVETDPAGRIRAMQSAQGKVLEMGYSPSGRLTSLETPLGQFQFAFDPAGRLQSLVELSGARRDSFEYDKGKRLIRRGVPGWTEQYGYDRKGRIATWTIRGQPSHKFDFHYDEQGRLETIGYPNGAQTRFDFDNKHRLLRSNMLSADSRSLFAMSVDYATSSRLPVATGSGADRFVYRYDDNLNLAGTTHPDGHSERFTYDALGNLSSAQLAEPPTALRYDPLGRPTQIGPLQLIYQPAGSPLPVLSSSTLCLFVDDQLRVVALARGDGLSAKYDYLPDDRMIRREVAGRVFVYDWDGRRLRSVFDGRGRLRLAIHYDPTFHLPLAVVLEGRTYYCHPDVFGRPEWLTNEKGESIEPPPDFPFEIRRPDQPTIWPTWTGLPPAVRLPEEGLLLVGGRLCDPRSGNLLSPNLHRFLESVNPYQARQVTQPLDLTDVWQKLASATRWIEELEQPRFQLRWPDGTPDGVQLNLLLEWLREPERIERHLLHRAFRHDSDPDCWLDPTVATGMETVGTGLPSSALEPPPTPADIFLQSSPLGPIPYDWNGAFGQLLRRLPQSK